MVDCGPDKGCCKRPISVLATCPSCPGHSASAGGEVGPSRESSQGVAKAGQEVIELWTSTRPNAWAAANATSQAGAYRSGLGVQLDPIPPFHCVYSRHSYNYRRKHDFQRGEIGKRQLSHAEIIARDATFLQEKAEKNPQNKPDEKLVVGDDIKNGGGAGYHIMLLYYCNCEDIICINLSDTPKDTPIFKSCCSFPVPLWSRFSIGPFSKLLFTKRQ